jgi:hypothetical protein
METIIKPYSFLGNIDYTKVKNFQISQSLSLPKFEYVSTKNDFPFSINGVITLEPETTYYVLGDIDLLGERIQTSKDTVILGSSSENSSLRSTGLANGTPLLTIPATCPIRNISFNELDTVLEI